MPQNCVALKLKLIFPYSQALGGENYDEQEAVLEKAMKYMKTNRNLSTKKPTPRKDGTMPPPRKPRIIKHQNGFLITVSANMALQKVMDQEYSVPRLKTAHTGQDFVERYFGYIRDMDGPNRYPSALQLVYRVSRDLTRTLLKVSS